MALNNPVTFTGAFMTFRMSLLCRTIRATIMRVRSTLRRMEIEKDGMPDLCMAAESQGIPVGRENLKMNVMPNAVSGM